MNANQKSRTHDAFTLVELLVVLGIISILAALIFSAFSTLRENGRRTVCASNQKQILLALQMYEQDSAGLFPYRNPLEIHYTVWIDGLLPYVNASAVFNCPSDNDIQVKTEYGYVMVGGVSSKHPSVPSSYIASEELFWDRVKGQIKPRLNSAVAAPATTVFLSDGVTAARPDTPYWTVEDNSRAASALAALGYILREPSQAHADGSMNEGYAPNPRHSQPHERRLCGWPREINGNVAVVLSWHAVSRSSERRLKAVKPA